MSRIAIAPLDLGSRRALPVLASSAHNQQRGGLNNHRAQHRAQCRANCMSKANF